VTTGEPLLANEASCRVAATDAERVASMAVRHAVFVMEQGVFADTDRDAIDDLPTTLQLIGCVSSDVVACVRVYPLEGQLWKGDRLAVLPSHRTASLGADLVRLAVATAAANGGTRMVAMIQLPNVRFFERLGWSCDGDPTAYAGQPHQPMVIDFS